MLYYSVGSYNVAEVSFVDDDVVHVLKYKSGFVVEKDKVCISSCI